MWVGQLGAIIESLNGKDNTLSRKMYLALLISSLFFSSQIMAREYCNVGFRPSGLIAAYADQLIKRSGKKRILKIYFGDKKTKRIFYLEGQGTMVRVLPLKAKTSDDYEKLIRKIEKKINLDFIFTEHLPMADIAIFLICAPKMKKRAGAFIYGGKKSYSRIVLNNCSAKHQTFAQKQQIFLHEFGHALGLEHPFDDGDGDCIYSTRQKGFDAVTIDSTLMAYAPPKDEANWPTWYKALDIIALRKIWGARP